MDALERLLAERACERLMTDYAWSVDSGNASRIADLFTGDGTWTGDNGATMDGQPAIRAAFERREAHASRISRHAIINTAIDVHDATTASGKALLVNYRHDRTDADPAGPGPARHPKYVGDYHLTFACVDGRWLIRTLHFELAFLRRHTDR